MSDMVRLAQRVATSAHMGQTDKAGQPYIDHPARVAARLLGDPEAQAVAWLHDVLEDTAVTAAELEQLGFPPRIIVAVEALTRRESDAGDLYYERVATLPLALKVKRADIADNTDPTRTAALDPETEARLRLKYEHALAVLDKYGSHSQR